MDVDISNVGMMKYNLSIVVIVKPIFILVGIH